MLKVKILTKNFSVSLSSRVKGRKKYDYGGCVENVKKRDYDGYLHCLVFPEHLVRFAFAIKAFNLELAMVPDQARSDPKIAQMRYKFWEDSIEQVFKGKSKFHPTLMELSFAVEKCKLSKEYFKMMIDARCNMLNMESVQSFSEYSDKLMEVYKGCNLLLLQLLSEKSTESKPSIRGVEEFSRAQGKYYWFCQI